MKRRFVFGLASAGLALAATLTIVACKQGEHDHCQVSDDCGDSYVCAQATQTCELPGGGSIDADTPTELIIIDAPDAPSIDAPPEPDAAFSDAPVVDGAVDAMVDAI